MALENFDDLKSSIADWLVDRDDLTTVIPDFIRLAEARFNREIRHRSMIKRSTMTLDTSTKYVVIPNDLMEVERFQLLTNPIEPLKPMTPNLLTSANAHTSQAKPQFYAVHECIELDAKPDTAYTAELLYYAEVEPLSDSNTENGLLNSYPDLYLWASLAAAEGYLGNDPRIATWASLYADVRDEVNKAHVKTRYSFGTLQSFTTGPTP